MRQNEIRKVRDEFYIRPSLVFEMIKCLELNISESCNYDCKYCVFRRNIKDSRLMDPKDALFYTEKYIEYLDGRQGHIYLGAAEPMLNWEAVEIVANRLAKEKNIWLSFMTNGSLMTLEKLSFLKEMNVSVGVSLDGKRERQIKNRPSVNGHIDTYQVVIDFLEDARKIDYKVFSISSTYCNPGFLSDSMHIIDLCKRYGVDEFDLDYDIEALTEDNYKIVADELIEIYEMATNEGLSMFGYWLIPYCNSLNEGKTNNYCGNAIKENVCISADGKCKICCYDSNFYGSFISFDEFDNEEYKKTLENYNKGFDECKKCRIQKECCGQCLLLDRESEARRMNCLFLNYIYVRMNKTPRI